MHHRYWPLKTSTALQSPFSSSRKRNQGYFFHCAFMSKRATECLIQGGELGVGRQLALDSMKASAIHSFYSLLDRNIIHGIITEYGCRRVAKHSQRPIVIASLASFTFSWICGFGFCMEMKSESGNWRLNHLIMAVFFLFPFLRLNELDLVGMIFGGECALIYNRIEGNQRGIKGGRSHTDQDYWYHYYCYIPNTAKMKHVQILHETFAQSDY